MSTRRAAEQLRPISVKKNYIKSAAGSVLIACGNTRIICTASIEQEVPRWRAGSGCGWVTAEYGMLPGATSQRKRRDRGGAIDSRSVEIQRLIGRSLRAVVDMQALGEISVWIDCDVIQADGGTRCAAITGGFIALHEALSKRHKAEPFAAWPIVDTVAAVSVGVVDGAVRLDLDYALDSTAEVDMNVVMTGTGRYVEVQGSAEGAPFSHRRLLDMLKLAGEGITQLTAVQCRSLKI